MNNILTTTKRYGLLLGFVALICTALSAGVYFATKDKINAVIEENQKALLTQVIPHSYYDNNLLTTCRPTAQDFIPGANIRKICIAKKQGKISAYAFETVAPEGYSGEIRLLVGLTPEGEVLGMRTIEQHETPGLGDKIELKFSDWALSFSHKFLRPDNLQDWAVKKDGGKFDQFTGATITPRTVVNQVKTASLALLKAIKQENIEQRLLQMPQQENQ